MNKLVQFVAACSMVAVFLGCSKEEGSGIITFEKLKPDAVLVKVGAYELTKTGYEAWVNYRMACYGFLAKGAKDENRANAEANVRASAVPTFIRNALMQSAADAFEKTNGVISAATKARALGEMIAIYEESSDQGTVLRFSDMTNGCARAGYYGEFMKDFRDECRTEAFIMSSMTNFMIVDGVTVRNFKAMRALHNAAAAATNDTILANANKALALAKQGGDFAELADRYSMDEDKEPGGDLGECTAADFGGEPEIFAKIDKLQDGEVVGLIDAEDSYRIYKLIKRISADKAEAQTESLHLAQIYFKRAVEMPPFTDDEVVHNLLGVRRDKVSEILLKQAMRDFKIEFPHGWEIIPGDQLRKFMAGVHESLHPGEENPYLTEEDKRKMAFEKMQKQRMMMRKLRKQPKGGVR